MTYEYKILTLIASDKKLLTDTLNVMTKDNWKLHSCIKNDNCYDLILERKIEGEFELIKG